MKLGLLIAGFLILIITEIGRVYFIMPMPGSQHADTIDLAYFISSYIGLFRLAGILLISWPLSYYLMFGSKAAKISVGAVLLIYIFILVLFNFYMMADKMFYQPTQTILSKVADSKVGQQQLVLGVTIHGESKAYPIEIIGYHHQVRDVVGGEQVMVTYCTVCRTGRVFSPKVDGRLETFRLVGMDHFNAMFEDAKTHSWWRQVTGEAVAGPLKGKMLDEIPSEQMNLAAWIDEHPATLVLQQDSVFQEEYDHMKNYDEGNNKGSLTLHDKGSWHEKSWVVGVKLGMSATAYDWNDLVKERILNDAIEGHPVAVLLQDDSVSFHAWDRVIAGDTLNFAYDPGAKYIKDGRTGSVWDWAGNCIEGSMKGTHLKVIQSYQEYWHSWRTFHPQTTRFRPNGKEVHLKENKQETLAKAN